MKRITKNYKRTRRYSFRQVFLILITCLSLSCKKDSSLKLEKPSDVSVVNGRLSFKTGKSFENFMSKISKTNEENINNVVASISGSPTFVSLSEFVANSEQIQLAKTSSLGKSFNQQLKSANSAGRISFAETSYEVDNDMLTTLEDLVPDTYFASILNPDMEVMVDDNIYKVTPYGTFIVEPQYYDELETILDNTPYDGIVEPTDPFYANEIGDHLFQVAPGIQLVDTYEATTSQLDDVLNIQYYPVAYNSVYQYTPDPDSWIYDNLPTIKYGGKTWAGKLIESIFGREEVYTEKFHSNRRVKVNCYNIHWVVYSAIGVSVQLQKKNWIGWSGANAAEMRLGWDAIEYSIGMPPVTIPQPANATPNRFEDGDDLPNLSKKYVIVNLLDKNITVDLNQKLPEGIKKIHSILPQIPGLKPKKDRDENYAFKVWTNNTKTAASVVLDRDEIVRYNVEKISKVFDWSVGIKASWNFESLPKLGVSPLKFEMKRASVFGIAKNDGIWKGARIVVGE